MDSVDPDPDSDQDPQTLILTSRSGEEDTASWARLSKRLYERLSEVRRCKNMWIRWIRIRIRRLCERLSEVRRPKNMWIQWIRIRIRIRIRKH